MDLQKAKILLEKVNALYKSMSADARHVSTIEKDLMRSYIQQLYEVFLDLPVGTTPPETPPVEIIKSSPKITLRKPEPVPPSPPVSTPKPVQTKQETLPEQAPAPDPIPAPAPVPEKKPEPLIPLPKVEPAPPVREMPNVAPPATSRPEPSVIPNEEEMEELFAFSSAKELSEKLSELPITDIKKAIGINERIFTINELFGGDQATFDLTLTTLNQLKNYEEAKDFLIRHVAGRFNWVAKDKKSKAKTFIKLVKRRYS
jgi:hypothetical protein